jgi:hypothetical protein
VKEKRELKIYDYAEDGGVAQYFLRKSRRKNLRT